MDARARSGGAGDRVSERDGPIQEKRLIRLRAIPSISARRGPRAGPRAHGAAHGLPPRGAAARGLGDGRRAHGRRGDPARYLMGSPDRLKG